MMTVIPSGPPPAMMLPFATMLLAIAVMPFIHRAWWESHFPKVATGLGAITVCYYVLALGNGGPMLQAAHDYVSFIALIGSLFVVSGGIYIGVKEEATPRINCLFLLIGAVLANFIGTTGASMLLIRPWMRMNQSRIAAFHIVFFIFIVANAGGCLTPIGDPPLFLGYLKGVPFWWMLQQCWIAWTVVIGGILAVFHALDRRNYLRATHSIPAKEGKKENWKIEGWRNAGFLALILAAVFIQAPVGLRESLMIVAAAGSWWTTPKRVHAANNFNFHPIREVAWLFAGIFATMVPALDYLELHAGNLGLNSEMKFFWLTGGLSGTLDNAPTYLGFLASAMGLHHLSLNNPEHVRHLAAAHGCELMAISLGAVFFGAITYIGNGPNFMVKAIAEQAKVKMPDFFAYLWKYALPVLLPLMALISLLFFSQWKIF